MMTTTLEHASTINVRTVYMYVQSDNKVLYYSSSRKEKEFKGPHIWVWKFSDIYIFIVLSSIETGGPFCLYELGYGNN